MIWSTLISLIAKEEGISEKGAKVVKSINVEEGINMDRGGGIFQKTNKRGGGNL